MYHFPYCLVAPALSARNLLAASSETAGSSRDNAALRNDNSLGIFKLHDCRTASRWRIFARHLPHIIVRMAKRSSKLLAVFLLLVVAAVSLPWQEPSPMHAQTAPAAGCHQHGAKPPARMPSSYRCCQLRHNSAVLQSSLTSQPSLVVVPGGSSSSPIVIFAQSDLRSAATSSPDPPLTIPLRV
jgi:hypothetical protein